MSASDVLAELESAGIHVSREGDNLRVRAQPGVSLAPFLERFKTHKAALLRELLQRRIVEALDVEPQNFDRAAYDELWRRWHTLQGQELDRASIRAGSWKVCPDCAPTPAETSRCRECGRSLVGPRDLCLRCMGVTL